MVVPQASSLVNVKTPVFKGGSITDSIVNIPMPRISMLL